MDDREAVSNPSTGHCWCHWGHASGLWLIPSEQCNQTVSVQCQVQDFLKGDHGKHVVQTHRQRSQYANWPHWCGSPKTGTPTISFSVMLFEQWHFNVAWPTERRCPRWLLLISNTCMHRIHFWPGLCPGPRWNSLRCSPGLRSWMAEHPLPTILSLDAFSDSILAPAVVGASVLAELFKIPSAATAQAYNVGLGAEPTGGRWDQGAYVNAICPFSYKTGQKLTI